MINIVLIILIISIVSSYAINTTLSYVNQVTVYQVATHAHKSMPPCCSVADYNTINPKCHPKQQPEIVGTFVTKNYSNAVTYTAKTGGKSGHIFLPDFLVLNKLYILELCTLVLESLLSMSMIFFKFPSSSTVQLHNLTYSL